MTPAELKHAAATEVMGWTLGDHESWSTPDEDGIQSAVNRPSYFLGEKFKVNARRWNPDTSHDQAHMVIDKAVELGVDPVAIVQLMWWRGITSKRTETPFHPLTATPAQKTEAAIMAVRAWRKEQRP